MRRVIANTTPLIALANIDRLELLRELILNGLFISDTVKRYVLKEAGE